MIYGFCDNLIWFIVFNFVIIYRGRDLFYFKDEKIRVNSFNNIVYNNNNEIIFFK